MPKQFQPAKTIDEVIARLDEIIATAGQKQDAHGIFPALYVIVTEKIKEGITRGNVFEDNVRMEKMDVIFANGFFRALEQYENGEQPCRSWALAFDTTKRFSRKVILQQLLVAMNAHINYDLGMAAAEVAPGEKIHGFKRDFDAINQILAELVDGVKQDLIDLSPRFSLILKRFKGKEDAILNFSVKKARDAAWDFAVKLARSEKKHKDERIIRRRDELTEKVGKRIVGPGLIGRLIVWWVKRAEEKDMQVILAELRNKSNARMMR